MKPIIANTDRIAACGLYCGACRKFLVGKCPGCRENTQATWCKIRPCCKEKGISTCAGCQQDVKECKTYSNFVSKLFGLLFRSDRAACIRYIREHGGQAYAEEMTRRQAQTMKK